MGACASNEASTANPSTIKSRRQRMKRGVAAASSLTAEEGSVILVQPALCSEQTSRTSAYMLHSERALSSTAIEFQDLATARESLDTPRRRGGGSARGVRPPLPPLLSPLTPAKPDQQRKLAW